MEEKIWDALRKKYVALTPEERVRQWFVGILHQFMEVPLHMMNSEVGFKLGGKAYRADIVVFDRAAKPLAVVECKRPEVELDEAVLEQAVIYNMVLNVKYIMVTNGRNTFIFRRGADGFAKVVELPKYDKMLED